MALTMTQRPLATSRFSAFVTGGAGIVPQLLEVSWQGQNLLSLHCGCASSMPVRPFLQPNSDGNFSHKGPAPSSFAENKCRILNSKTMEDCLHHP